MAGEVSNAGEPCIHHAYSYMPPWFYDLPDSYQWQLAELLPPSSCHALLGASRSCRDLVLKHSLGVKLSLVLDAPDELIPLQKRPSQRLATALSGPCHGREIRLAVSRSASLDLRAALHSAPALFTQCMQSLSTPLVALRRIELMGLFLERLVPEYLTQSCPNLTTLTLNCCTIRELPSPDTPQPPCPQLKELLIRVSAINPLLEPARLEHQLRALPNLSAVTLTYLDSQWAACVQCFTVLGSQLTQLTTEQSSHTLCAGMAVREWFPALNTLDLGQARINDPQMEVLLSLPALRRLTVWTFELALSYAESPCRWEHLGMRSLRVACCAHLPLKGLQRLEMVRPSTNPTAAIYVLLAWTAGGPAADMDRTAAALANLERCGGLHWPEDAQVVINGAVALAPGVLGCVPPTHVLLAASLPLLSRLQGHLVIEGVQPVTPALVTALGQVVGSQAVSKGLSKVTFKDCTYSDGGGSTAFCAAGAGSSVAECGGAAPSDALFGMLLPALPPSVDRVVIDWSRDWWAVPESSLAALVSHACRPTSLEVNASGLEEGWEGRLDRAMQDQGHRWVEVMRVQPPPRDPEWITRLFFMRS